MFEFYHNVPQQSTKICPECDIEKPLNEFPRTQPRCKQCEMARRKKRAQDILATIPADTTKVCKRCGIEKPLNDFYECTGGTLGHTARCKLCTIEAAGYKNHLPQHPSAQHGGKVCHKCHQEKSLDEFNKDKRRPDGLDLICKECSRVYHRNYEYRTGRKHQPTPLPPVVNGGRVCRECLKEKPFEDFQKQKKVKDGYSTSCKECTNAKGREYYVTRYRENILKKNQRWYENNRQYHGELSRKWREANRLKSNEYSYRRHARKKATMIDKVDYERILEKSDGICYICETIILPHHKFEFDHIIPIDRDGPHTEENIAVVHQCCNRRKSNKLLSEMNAEQRRGPKD